MPTLLRRLRLGKGSCKAIKEKSEFDFKVTKNPDDIPDNELVFRWGCTATIPAEIRTVNKASAIHLVNDKLAFRKLLEEKSLCPRTIWKDCGWSLACPDRPVIVRPQVHHQGRHLYVANSEEELEEAIIKCGEGWYASEYIDKIAEYRVFIVQGRTVCVASKTPKDPSAVAWNVFQGGKFENVNWADWPLRAVRVATEAFALSGLDFGGVDIMEDKDGEVYVLEINSAPSLTSPYRQSCFAKAFDWIVKYGTKPIKLIGDKGGYRKFIHPAVCEEALLTGEH